MAADGGAGRHFIETHNIMKTYWEITHERGVPTVAVWLMNPTFELRGGLTRASHSTNVDLLPAKAQLRADAEGILDGIREDLRKKFDKMRELAVRAPGVIDEMITEEDDLHDLLDRVFASDATDSETALLRRARLVVELWLAFDELQTAMVPPKPGLTLKYKDGNDVETDENASTFASLVVTCLAGQNNEAVAIKNVSATKTALRTLERKVDRHNKRWYGAWTKAFLAGTAEGDAARSQVPTEQGTLPAQALQILTATAQVDRTVQLTFDPEGGLHATTQELQWRLPGDVDFGHTIPVVRAGQTVGPFPANTLVIFRTRAANSTPGVALSATVGVQVN